MNEEVLLKLPNQEYMQWLQHIRSTLGPLSAENVLVVKTWLKKTLLPHQLKQFLHNWTGEMVVAPLADTNMLAIYLVKSDGQRQAVTTSLGNMQKCIRKKAFRIAIANQTVQFRQDWLNDSTKEKVCAHCKCELETKEAHVDHVHVPFCDLLQQFLQQEGLPNTAVHIHRETIQNGVECWMLQDKQLRRRWQDFHRTHAQLQMLCKPCNVGPCNTRQAVKKQTTDAPVNAETCRESFSGCTSDSKKPAKKKRKMQDNYVPPLFFPFAFDW